MDIPFPSINTGGYFHCYLFVKLTQVFYLAGRAVLSAGRYHDTSEEGKFYAVVLEQTFVPGQVQGQGTMELGTVSP
jgi:hypothetical protein